MSGALTLRFAGSSCQANHARGMSVNARFEVYIPIA
jgi:hypothetical protein